MKKILLSIILISLVLSGCSPASQSKAKTNQGESRIKYTECLTLRDIKTAFAREDLQLIENKKESPAYYQLDYAMPAIFNIKDSNQILLIYVFNTIADCKQICPCGGSGWVSIVDIPRNYHPIRVYATRNVLLIDTFNKAKAQEIKPKDLQVLKALLNITYSLNDSHKVIYKAKGRYWNAQYTAAYYQNWYKDEQGVARSDQYSKAKWELKYIGPDPESIKGFSCEYATPDGGGSMLDDGPLQKIGKNYFVIIWDEGSNIPDKNSVLTMTIKWDGKEESLKLRAIDHTFPFSANRMFMNQNKDFLWEIFN